MSCRKNVPGNLDDKPLTFDHALTHALYSRKRETPSAVADFRIEDLVDYHALLVAELERRGIRHVAQDELDGIAVNTVTVQGLRSTADQITAKSIYLPSQGAMKVWQGEKTYIIKGRSYSGMINKALYWGDVNNIYGVLKLTTIDEVREMGFKKSQSRHCLTEDDRQKFWPDNNVLYGYDLTILNRFETPLPHRYPRGVKVFFPSPQWINNSDSVIVAVDIDKAIAKADANLPLPDSYLKATPVAYAKELLTELAKNCTLVLYTERDSRYYELTAKWLAKNDIPCPALVIGPIPADITITDLLDANVDLLQDVHMQKMALYKSTGPGIGGVDSIDGPFNVFAGRTTEGVMTTGYTGQKYPTIDNLMDADMYDPHKLPTLTLLRDAVICHRWWRLLQDGQPFRFDAATVKELHDAIVRELDARGLPPHQTPLIVKQDGFSVAPGGIVGVNNMGGGEAPPVVQPLKETNPVGWFWPSYRRDPKTGKVLPSERPPVNPMKKHDSWNIRFLGTAGSKETKRRHNSSIIYEEQGATILVDLGSDDLAGKIPAKLDAALVTHGHPDHTAALSRLEPNVPIYMHRETWRDLLMHLPEIADKLQDREIILVDSEDPINVAGACRVCWLPVDHHEEFSTYGLLINDTVLYSPDFSELNSRYLDEVNTWIVDGNMLLTDEDPQPPPSDEANARPLDAEQLHSGHQCVLTSLKQAKDMNVRRVVVTHFSAQNDNISQENMAKLLADLALQAGYTYDVLAAYDGFTLTGGIISE